MENITVKDIVEITGGRLLCGNPDTPLTDLCTNSQNIKEGDLFIPLPGEKTDGHLYIQSAMEIGAATLTAQHDEAESEKAYIRVADTMEALRTIGRYFRNKFRIQYIGVTGSVGKTTTREMIAAALSIGMCTYQTPKNYNSQVGVPVTLSGICSEHKAAVVEMGISKEGEMAILADIVRPHMCVVTMIGDAHIDELKSKENIRREKLSIIKGMSEDGILFMNGDDIMLREVKEDLPCRTITYGFREDCDYRACDVYSENRYMLFDCVHGDERVPVRLSILGKHNVSNCLAALAVADQMGIPMEQAAQAFPFFEGQRQRVIEQKGRFTIIDDTYNANPASMRAGINMLCDMPCEGRKFAVLGDMLDLGPDSQRYHREIGVYLRDKKIDEVIVIGDMAQEIKRGLEENGNGYPKVYSFKDMEEIALYLTTIMKSEDIVFLKASHGMNFKEVVNLLTNY